MSNSKFIWSVGILTGIILLIGTLLNRIIIYPLFIGQTYPTYTNYFFDTISYFVYGIMICWLYQHYCNKLRGSNSIKKGMIFMGTIWILLGAIGLILSLIALEYFPPNPFKQSFYNVNYMVVSSLVSLITWLFIGLLIGKLWDKFQQISPTT